MPPKKHAKLQQVDEPTSLSSSTYMPTPTTVSLLGKSSPPLLSPSRPATKHERTATKSLPTEYVSPVKKLKKSMEQHKRRFFDTIEDLRDFISNNDMDDPNTRASVRIQGRVLWMRNDQVNNTTRYLRIYLGEQRASEPLDEQVAIFQEAQQDDPFEANQYLLTVSLYDINADNPMLPRPGSIISFAPTKLRVYRDCCQLDTKLHLIKTICQP